MEAIIGVVVGGVVTLVTSWLTARQAAKYETERRAEDAREREGQRERDRIEALRQEKLGPYRELRATTANLIGTTGALDQADGLVLTDSPPSAIGVMFLASRPHQILCPAISPSGASSVITPASPIEVVDSTVDMIVRRRSSSELAWI